MNPAKKFRVSVVAVMMGAGLLTPALAQPASPLSKTSGTTVIYREGVEENFVGRSGSSLQEVIVAPLKPQAVVSPLAGIETAATLAPLDPNWGKLSVNTAVAADLMRVTNHARARHGLRPLTADPRLAAAAERHSAEMLTLGYFSHTSPTPGRTQPLHRARAAGAVASRVSENLFEGDGYLQTRLAGAALDAWLDSPRERSNLLDPRATHVGFGVVESAGRVRVTQVLAGELR